MLSWWKRGPKPDREEVAPSQGPELSERLLRIAANALAPAPPPPPPPPVILLLEAPNHRREFVSRFPWTGGVSPFNPVEEVKRRPARDQRRRHWWDR